MNFALASMDALIYPFFWTWKVSPILSHSLGGTLGPAVSFSWSPLTTVVSAFTSVPKESARAPVLTVSLPCHTIGPENDSYVYFSPSLCHLDPSSIVTGSSDPCGRMGYWDPAHVTAFHASPCKYQGYLFSIGTSPLNRHHLVQTWRVLRSFHSLVMVSIFYFSCPSLRNRGAPHIYTSLRISFSLICDGLNTFLPFNHYIGSSCDHPLTSLMSWKQTGVLTFFSPYQIGPTASGTVEAPLWSYKLGLDNGWMSKDPRDSVGRCKDLGVPNDGFNGQYQGYATGSGGEILPSSVIASWPFPPASISNAPVPASQLPMYTSTGTIVTLPPPTNTGKISGMDGWFDSQDTALAPTPIQGCAYPDAYSTSGVIPASGCSTAGGSSPTPAS